VKDDDFLKRRRPRRNAQAITEAKYAGIASRPAVTLHGSQGA
jgi:hypothetical protein